MVGPWGRVLIIVYILWEQIVDIFCHLHGISKNVISLTDVIMYSFRLVFGINQNNGSLHFFFSSSNCFFSFPICCTTYESGDIALHIHFISDTINFIVQV